MGKKCTHKAAEMGILQCSFGLIDFLELDEGVGALDLHADKAAIRLKVFLQVALLGVFHVEIHHKERGCGADVAPPLLFPLFYVAVALLRATSQSEAV